MILCKNTSAITTKTAHNLTRGSGDRYMIQLLSKHVYQTARRSPSRPAGRKIRCVSEPWTPMHGCPKSGSLFTPIANDVVDARRHVNKTFVPWNLCIVPTSQHHHHHRHFFFATTSAPKPLNKNIDFLNISQKTVRSCVFFDLQIVII